MKQIYNFEQAQPPVLNERMIRLQLEKRRLHFQTALIAFAAILIVVAMFLLGVSAYETYPWFTLFCFLYALTSTTCGGALAIIFTRKGGQLICQNSL